MPSMVLDRSALSDFDEAIRKEWILTNGAGGYASSTVLGINTRKYHGLLVASFHPPADRRVCLAKLDEEMRIGNSSYLLGANEFQGRIFPLGHLFLTEFSLSPFPRSVFVAQNVEIRKSIFMPEGKNAALAVYEMLNRNGFSVGIQISPLVSGRHFHSVVDRWRNPTDFIQRQDGNEVEISSKNLGSALLMKSIGGQYHERGKWVEEIFYREEAARGEASVDDWFQPGYFEAEVEGGRKEEFAIIAVADEKAESAREVLNTLPDTMYDVKGLVQREEQRLDGILTGFYESHEKIHKNDWLSWLVLAANSFIVRGATAAQKSVIAGYHWFESWGRDTFVSLPGLMLVTGRFEDAKKIFLSFKDHVRNGLVPNFVPDRAEAIAYNTVDASLWFVNAVLQYVKYTADFDFVREQLWETLRTVVESHVKGTDFGIRVDSDGLLSHGSQLTWMDAAVDGQPVTPRAGKAVEIQALWYNALKTVELLANRFKDAGEAERCRQLAGRARKSFAEKFWNSQENCLLDVVAGDNGDGSLRPNQIIAAALDFAMLDGAANEKIVDVVHRELVTPCGLRTLARSDSRYVGVYAGDRSCRDRAYHNGVAWPWLLGPFVTAFLRTKGYSEYRREYALKSFLWPLFSEQIFRAGLGSVSEVFDGEPPYTPGGCIAQAWSVAEPLRAYVEDVMQVRPKYERDVLRSLG